MFTLENTQKIVKSDLKTGMVVTLRNEIKFVVFLDVPKDSSCCNSSNVLFSAIDSWMDLESYDENLLFHEKDMKSEYDIIKVEKPNYIYAIGASLGNLNSIKKSKSNDCDSDMYQYTTIWERK